MRLEINFVKINMSDYKELFEAHANGGSLFKMIGYSESKNNINFIPCSFRDADVAIKHYVGVKILFFIYDSEPENTFLYLEVTDDVREFLTNFVYLTDDEKKHNIYNFLVALSRRVGDGVNTLSFNGIAFDIKENLNIPENIMNACIGAWVMLPEHNMDVQVTVEKYLEAAERILKYNKY